jgi:uncharacterized small protein (DUF1192 family)
MIQLIILLILMIPILAIVLDSQLGRALAARLENRSVGTGDDVTGERIALLEGEVERLGSELNRLEEESEFLHKLLTERASGESPGGSTTAGEDHGTD